jgi:hypothetical protein
MPCRQNTANRSTRPRAGPRSPAAGSRPSIDRVWSCCILTVATNIVLRSISLSLQRNCLAEALTRLSCNPQRKGTTKNSGQFLIVRKALEILPIGGRAMTVCRRRVQQKRTALSDFLRQGHANFAHQIPVSTGPRLIPIRLGRDIPQGYQTPTSTPTNIDSLLHPWPVCLLMQAK